MVIFIFLVILSYLIGSFPSALLFGKIIFKKDIRKLGSGNPGSTNVFRVFGFIPALIVLTFDIFKGFLATSLSTDPPVQFFLVLSVIFGHIYPLLSKFRGGKAVATTIGCFLSINPLLMILPVIVYFIVLLTTRIGSVASICLICSILISAVIVDVGLLFSILIVICILITFFTHRENIEKIITDQEKKLF